MHILIPTDVPKRYTERHTGSSSKKAITWLSCCRPARPKRPHHLPRKSSCISVITLFIINTYMHFWKWKNCLKTHHQSTFSLLILNKVQVSFRFRLSFSLPASINVTVSRKFCLSSSNVWELLEYTLTLALTKGQKNVTDIELALN
jgi:hypothetical protein